MKDEMKVMQSRGIALTAAQFQIFIVLEFETSNARYM